MDFRPTINQPVRLTLHRHTIPRFADAIPVYGAVLKRIDHIRRRQDNDVDVFFRVDAAGGKPVAKF